MRFEDETKMAAGAAFREGIMGALPGDSPVESAVSRGGGRWVYCKYCYKSVLPFLLTEEWGDGGRQVLLCCSLCDAGLDLLERAEAI